MVPEDKLIRQARQEGITRLAVGVVVQDGSRVLLLQRTAGDFLGGLFELPGGQVEAGESLEQAILRELQEEAGLAVIKIQAYLGHFDYPAANGALTRQFNFQVQVERSSPIILREHDASRWAKKADLAGLHLSKEVRSLLEAALAEGPVPPGG